MIYKLLLALYFFTTINNVSSQNLTQQVAIAPELIDCTTNNTLNYVISSCPKSTTKESIFDEYDCVSETIVELMTNRTVYLPAQCLAQELLITGFIDDCHWIIHEIAGKIYKDMFEEQYQLYGDDQQSVQFLIDVTRKIISEGCSSICIDGCTHMSVMMFLRHVKNLCPEQEENSIAMDESLVCEDFTFGVQNLCKKRSDSTPDGIEHSKRFACEHGIGHGLKHLFPAQRAVDICSPLHFARACIGGVMMELIHEQTLENSDEWFKEVCYKHDWTEMYILSCMGDLGEGFMFLTEHNLTESKRLCEIVGRTPMHISTCQQDAEMEQRTRDNERAPTTQCKPFTSQDSEFRFSVCQEFGGDSVGSHSGETDEDQEVEGEFRENDESSSSQLTRMICSNLISGWTDSDLHSCTDYAEHIGWCHEHVSSLAADPGGNDATSVCCVCGGGVWQDYPPSGDQEELEDERQQEVPGELEHENTGSREDSEQLSPGTNSPHISPNDTYKILPTKSSIRTHGSGKDYTDWSIVKISVFVIAGAVLLCVVCHGFRIWEWINRKLIGKYESLQQIEVVGETVTEEVESGNSCQLKEQEAEVYAEEDKLIIENVAIH